MIVTNIILIICAGVFIYINFVQQGDKMDCALRLGAFYPPNVRERKEYWRFMTCHFIHIDFLHFLMNAYAIYELGKFFEYILGTGSYLIHVVVSMLLSSLMCYSAAEISSRYDWTVTIGASGIVYGFFGAICALGFLVGGIYMNLLEQFLTVIFINLLYTLFNPRISKTGHLGGFIGGILSIVILLVLKLI